MNQLANQLDADIVGLLCIGGILPNKACRFARQTTRCHAASSYEPVAASKLKGSLIPMELEDAFVRTKQL
jgi:hypothetical protein